jgi:hypothetical protein
MRFLFCRLCDSGERLNTSNSLLVAQSELLLLSRLRLLVTCLAIFELPGMRMFYRDLGFGGTTWQVAHNYGSHHAAVQIDPLDVGITEHRLARFRGEIIDQPCAPRCRRRIRRLPAPLWMLFPLHQ